MNYRLSTSIYDLVLINVCHFHHPFQWQLFNFGLYRDTRAYILDLASRNFIIWNKESSFYETKVEIQRTDILEIPSIIPIDKLISENIDLRYLGVPFGAMVHNNTYEYWIMIANIPWLEINPASVLGHFLRALLVKRYWICQIII